MQGQRPTVIAALLDQVQLIAAAWTVLGFPKLPLGVEGQALGGAMAYRPDFGRIPRLANEGIILGRRAVGGQVHDLAQRLVGILGRGETLAIAGGEEQRLAVGRKGDGGAELAALAPRAIAPDDLQAFQGRGLGRAAVIDDQPGLGFGRRQPGPGAEPLGGGLARPRVPPELPPALRFGSLGAAPEDARLQRLQPRTHGVRQAGALLRELRPTDDVGARGRAGCQQAQRERQRRS